jgi:NAD(P)-dependent dehydrogenase (short-subunit alcohol dehydrogenase family)
LLIGSFEFDRVRRALALARHGDGTTQSALGRFGTTTEIADLVLFLASPASDLITGQVIFADGGYTAL